MRAPVSTRAHTVSIANALSTTSELDHICSGFVITLLRGLISNDCIKNRKNLSASVTLSQKGKENLLRHFVLLCVSNCEVPSLYSCDRSKCQSEIEHIAIQLDDIYLRIIILNAVRGAIRTAVF